MTGQWLHDTNYHERSSFTDGTGRLQFLSGHGLLTVIVHYNLYAIHFTIGLYKRMRIIKKLVA